jgi:mRNA turnover protein 4
MPKSRRAKIAPLTVTKAKGREHKEALVEKIRAAIETYPAAYAFQIHNLRTNLLQAVRDERRADSRLFLGNNKVMMIAIGRDAAESQKPNLFKLGKFMTGLCGILFTHLPKKEVKEYFAGISGTVFARTGQPSTVDFTIPAGPLPQFPHSMHDQLSRLGLPVKLDKGIITVLSDTIVSEVGQALSAEAAQLLKLFGMATADFRIELMAHWQDGVARKISDKA